jgi:hypothetical protein
MVIGVSHEDRNPRNHHHHHPHHQHPFAGVLHEGGGHQREAHQALPRQPQPDEQPGSEGHRPRDALLDESHQVIYAWTGLTASPSLSQ